MGTQFYTRELRRSRLAGALSMRGRVSDVERRRHCRDDVKLAIGSAVGAGDVAAVAEGHSSCATQLVDVPGSLHLAQ